MSAHDPRTTALPLVRVALACRGQDETLRSFLDDYRSCGVFVASERVHPVGEKIHFLIELLDSVDYASMAVVVAHERKGAKLGMRLRLEPLRLEPSASGPSRDDTAPGAPPRGATSPDDAPHLRERPTLLAMSFAADHRETGCRAHWPAPVRALFVRASIEAIEGLHRTCVRTRDLEPETALAAAEAMVELARSDSGGPLVRSVRLLTRDGHEILELALERLEGARTPADRSAAQQLFDDTLRTVVAL
jgi:hypothetical protein